MGAVVNVDGPDFEDSYVPKNDYLSLKEQVIRLEKKQDAYDSAKKGQSSTIAWVVAGVAFFGSVLAFGKNFIAGIIKPK